MHDAIPSCTATFPACIDLRLNIDVLPRGVHVRTHAMIRVAPPFRSDSSCFVHALPSDQYDLSATHFDRFITVACCISYILTINLVTIVL